MSSGTASSTSETSGGIRYFFGESEDYKEYRRWKLWLSNKFKTLDKLQPDARGPYLFTCLTGKALETVEHVDPAQTSISQHSFPEPPVHHLLEANNVIRRAKQFSDLDVTFEPIPVDQLRLCCHSDAAWANVGAHTQAGYVIGFTTAELDAGIETTWTPAIWKSFRLSRAVGSTLAAEPQSMVAATGTLEWTCLLLAEEIDGIDP